MQHELDSAKAKKFAFVPWPHYLENAFPAEWRPANRLTMAQELGATSLMFQVHPTLSESDMYDIAAIVRDVMRQATA
jgi:dTDP-4-amino-4,6-dideoxygalactose transaminase